MKLFLAIGTIVFLSSCSTLPPTNSSDYNHRAVRLDTQASLMTGDTLDDEEPMPSGRVSFQWQTREEGDAPKDANHFTGVVPQIGFGYGQASQTIDIDGVGEFDFDMQQAHIDLGVRFYDDVGTPAAQPFFGIGFTPTWTQFDDGGSTEDVVTPGYYAEIGVDGAVGRHVRWGLGVRYTGGMDGSIEGEDVDLDNVAAMFSVGVSF